MRLSLFAVLLLMIVPSLAHAQSSQATVTLTVTIPGDSECGSGCSATLTTDPTSATNMIVTQQKVLNAGAPPHPSCAPSCTKTNVVSIMATQFAAQGAAFAAQALATPGTTVTVTAPTPTAGEATP